MRLVLAVALTMIASASSAQVSGKQVLEGCKQSETNRASFERGVCTGIAMAIASFGDALPEKNCVPKGVSANETARVLALWLTRHPERLDEPVVDLAMYAFAEAWPCR
jgi:F0F1-type ATP synthase membrane subunit c/vacuolar-type H+-ATPase subunit K